MLGLKYWSCTVTEILVLEYWDWDVCLGILGLRYVYRNTGTEMSILEYWD